MSRKRRSRRKKTAEAVAEPVMEQDKIRDVPKRIASMGVSFLRLTISTLLFQTFPNYNEGKLTAKFEDEIQKLKTYGRRSIYTLTGCKIILDGVKSTFTFLTELTSFDELIFKARGTKLKHINKIYQEKQFQQLEAKTGYKFQNRALLLQAFTNESHKLSSKYGTYQRLEFLGDAVLEYLVVRYLFNHPSKFDRGEIAKYRGLLTSNETFATLTTKYGLPNFILADPNVNVTSQKSYADIFESLAGAIYIDSGMDLDVVWNIFYEIFKRLKCFKKLDAKFKM